MGKGIDDKSNEEYIKKRRILKAKSRRHYNKENNKKMLHRQIEL
jgi:hypothetical protein